jgi:hypothetical protein
MIVVAPTMRSRRIRDSVPAMPNAQPLQIGIAVERRAAPVSGRVVTDRGPERRFTGWTELFAALQAVIAEANHQEGSTK